MYTDAFKGYFYLVVWQLSLNATPEPSSVKSPKSVKKGVGLYCCSSLQILFNLCSVLSIESLQFLVELHVPLIDEVNVFLLIIHTAPTVLWPLVNPETRVIYALYSCWCRILPFWPLNCFCKLLPTPKPQQRPEAPLGQTVKGNSLFLKVIHHSVDGILGIFVFYHSQSVDCWVKCLTPVTAL